MDTLVFTSMLLTYVADGKAKSEAVFFQYAICPATAVRFLIMMGIDDYTECLHFHVKHVANNEIYSPYVVPASWYMTTEKAQQAGFVFSKLNDRLLVLIC